MNLGPWFKQILNSWNVLVWYHQKNLLRELVCDGIWVIRIFCIPFDDFVSGHIHIDLENICDAVTRRWQNPRQTPGGVVTRHHSHRSIASGRTFRTAVWNIKHRIYAQSLEDFCSSPRKTNNFRQFRWISMAPIGSCEISDLLQPLKEKNVLPTSPSAIIDIPRKYHPCQQGVSFNGNLHIFRNLKIPKTFNMHKFKVRGFLAKLSAPNHLESAATCS